MDERVSGWACTQRTARTDAQMLIKYHSYDGLQ